MILIHDMVDMSYCIKCTYINLCMNEVLRASVFLLIELFIPSFKFDFFFFAGYRHIPLRNECNLPLLMPTVFVHISVKDYVPDDMSGKDGLTFSQNQ